METTLEQIRETTRKIKTLRAKILGCTIEDLPGSKNMTMAEMISAAEQLKGRFGKK